MAFREKAAWISLLSVAGVYGVYFFFVIRAGHAGAPGGHFFGLLETVIALVVIQVGLLIAVSIVSPRDAREPRDERERLIDMRATRQAYHGLATGIALACFFGAFTPPIIFNTNALLFVLVTAELLRSTSQIIQYRRQA